MTLRRLLGILGVIGGLLFLLVLYFVSRPTPEPTPPPTGATLAFDLVACKEPPKDNYCAGPPDATFSIHLTTHPDTYRTVAGDGNGYVFVSDIPATLHDTDI